MSLCGRPRKRRQADILRGVILADSCRLKQSVHQRNPRRTCYQVSRRGFWHRLFGTLLSSQGAGAHRYLAFRPDLGATSLGYPVSRCGSNPLRPPATSGSEPPRVVITTRRSGAFRTRSSLPFRRTRRTWHEAQHYVCWAGQANCRGVRCVTPMKCARHRTCACRAARRASHPAGRPTPQRLLRYR